MGRALLPGLLVAAVALAACSDDGPHSLPPPSSTSSTAPEPTTTTIDFSEVALDTVPGETTTTLVAEGDVVLSGVVGGPEGAVPGAIVRAERLVDDAVQPFEIRADDQGVWRLENLPGGRYRVRAYLPPDLAMADPVIFYVRDDDDRDVPLTMTRFDGLDVVGGTTPTTLFVGDAVNLAVRVTERFVDEEGRGQLRPVGNVPVRVRSTGWRERGEPVGTTNEDGIVMFGFECDRVAPVSATAIVGEDRERFVLDVPSCEPRPTTTTEESSADDGSTTTTDRSTTTTARRSTTSTTEAD